MMITRKLTIDGREFEITARRQDEEDGGEWSADIAEIDANGKYEWDGDSIYHATADEAFAQAARLVRETVADDAAGYYA